MLLRYKGINGVDDFLCNDPDIGERSEQLTMYGSPGTEVKPDPRRKVDGKFLTLEGLVKGDTAVFQCNASNIHGYAFKNFYVNVLGENDVWMVMRTPGMSFAFQ